MAEFEESVAHSVDTDMLPVVVAEACYAKCRKLGDKLTELFDTAEDRQTDELALICEGRRLLLPCSAIVVRTTELDTVVAGSYFGMINTHEVELYAAAQAQNEVHGLEVAFTKLKKVKIPQV